MSEITIIEADFMNQEHREAVFQLTVAYAKDPMGMDRELDEDVKERLLDGLSEFPGTLCLLAFVQYEPVGIANCFFGYSTFGGKKVLNIHDLAVLPKMRGRGVGEKLLDAVTQKAKETDCCKVTLEVREDNPAQRLYERSGFSKGTPPMYFMTKKLS